LQPCTIVTWPEVPRQCMSFCSDDPQQMRDVSGGRCVQAVLTYLRSA